MTAGTTILATSPDGQYFVYDPFLSAGAGYYLYDRNTGVSTEFLQNVTPTPQIYAVNDSGDVVGTATVNGVFQGFSYLNGAVALVNVPGSLMEQWAVFGSGSSSNLPPRNSTTPYAINHAGNITGTYIDGMGAAHAFTDFNGVYTLNLPTSILNSPSTVTVPPATNVVIDDKTTGITAQAASNLYTGPTGTGLTSEFINLSTDKLDIAAITPNQFIQAKGNDAINVSTAGGNNTLDGGTGSNFLVGGQGDDTFFVDDLDSTVPIWSTLVGFHAADNATIWGVTPADFKISWMGGQGGAGYGGLTMHATAPGKPNVLVTLAGMTPADLSNGSLAVNFGRSSLGVPYMELSHL